MLGDGSRASGRLTHEDGSGTGPETGPPAPLGWGGGWRDGARGSQGGQRCDSAEGLERGWHSGEAEGALEDGSRGARDVGPTALLGR